MFEDMFEEENNEGLASFPLFFLMALGNPNNAGLANAVLLKNFKRKK